MTTKVAGNVELTATASGILLGAGLAVYPIEHHAGFILALLAGLALVLAVYLRYVHDPRPIWGEDRYSRPLYIGTTGNYVYRAYAHNTTTQKEVDHERLSTHS